MCLCIGFVPLISLQLLMQPQREYKVKSSLKLMCDGCRFVIRKGKLRVVCTKKQRHKQRQGWHCIGLTVLSHLRFGAFSSLLPCHVVMYCVTLCWHVLCHSLFECVVSLFRIVIYCVTFLCWHVLCHSLFECVVSLFCVVIYCVTLLCWHVLCHSVLKCAVSLGFDTHYSALHSYIYLLHIWTCFAFVPPNVMWHGKMFCICATLTFSWCVCLGGEHMILS